MISVRIDALLGLRSTGGPRAEELKQLDRILASGRFQERPREHRELRWLVEESVLGKYPTPGSCGSSTVLAEMLRLYAKHEGAFDPIRILLQPDSHLPAFLRNHPKLFVSHRHRDSVIAKALMSTFEAAFVMSKNDARCTSAPPYRLGVGEASPSRLRDEIATSEVVIGLIAPDVNQSGYVPFELGAAWSRKRLTWPLLVRGATTANLPAPIRNLNSLSLADPSDCEELLDEIDGCTTLQRRSGVGGDVHNKIEMLASLAAESL